VWELGIIERLILFDTVRDGMGHSIPSLREVFD
jgi:hypothetical protein